MIDDPHYQTIAVAVEENKKFVVSEGSTQTIQWQIPQATKLSRADLHIHSTYSDGIPTIQQILEHTERHTDLDVIAITDHNVVDGSLRARDLWASASYRFDFIVGEEVSTNEGHLLALFIEKRIPPHFSMERSIDLIHEQGGLAIVVHPLNPLFRMSCQREVLDRIHANKDLWLDGIETWNAGLCGIYANRVTMRANRQFYGWSEVGNSDAHTLNAIGRACTLFQGSTASDVRTAIQSGFSTPGGKLWHVNDFLVLASYHINKRRSARRQPAA
jgi:predicted metal-dependent phosphoesterase TrpH